MQYRTRHSARVRRDCNKEKEQADTCSCLREGSRRTTGSSARDVSPGHRRARAEVESMQDQRCGERLWRALRSASGGTMRRQVSTRHGTAAAWVTPDRFASSAAHFAGSPQTPDTTPSA
eukprot:2246193-Rhodomonas_salina.4